MAATTKAKSGPMIPSWNDEVAYALVFPMILPLLRNFKSPGRHSFGEKTYFCALLNDNRLKTKELWPVIKTKTWINSVTLSAWE